MFQSCNWEIEKALLLDESIKNNYDIGTVNSLFLQAFI